MKLSDALKEFERWGRGHYAERTVDVYTGLIKKFIKHCDDKSIETIMLDDVVRYISYLHVKNYAESTIAYMIISLRVFFKYFFLKDAIHWNYELIVVPRYSQKNFPTIRTEQALAMMKSIQVKDFESMRDLMVVRFLWATGVRASELCKNITTEQVDTDNRQAIIKTMKSKKNRVIFWDPETNEMIKKYLFEREKWARDDSFIIGLAQGPYFGCGITTRTVQRIIKKHRLPGTQTVSHSFRSGLITEMLEKDVNLRVLQSALGHQSIYSLESYARVTNPLLQKEYRRVRG